IVFDEAHRVMADSYQDIAASLPRARVLGLTATPCRTDNRGLGDFFQFMRVMAKPSELYAGGYLERPKAFGASVETLAALQTRLSKVGTSYGDFTPKPLARAVDTKFLVGNVVTETIKRAPKVPKVVFAC